ncbi:DUF1516 family protein [Liquorilactobacillus mali]|uniref:DUF1516 family protein n=1 Tax=Liquorilactobacillus mali TaxID=1618 RepID=UPI00265011FD|nr:DUF1516 family protein [Liquorilactobacillus mali]MDN7144581.1 DUF1516 family protein [Liquorilactobacillus mali]
MIWLWMHLFSWIVLLIVVLLAVFSRNGAGKLLKMIARICYMVAIISGIILLKYAWETSPVLAIVKVILAIGLIGFCEIYFSRKKGVGNSIKALLVTATIVVGIIGFILAGGRPF